MQTQWTTLENYKGGPGPEGEGAPDSAKFRVPARGGGLNLFNQDFLSRRDFIEWVGGVSAVLATSACTRQPDETIIPYSKMPEAIIPGKPVFYASAFEHSGVSTGILVESHMGRPTKIEGNPDHSGSLGATDAFAQASILSLYDPDRAKSLVAEGNITFWGDFVAQLEGRLKPLRDKQGAGLRILTEGVTSPTFLAQMQALLKKYPQAVWHQYEAVSWDSKYEGARMAFGDAVETRYAFDKAEVVLSLDSDFLYGEPGSVRYMRDFTSRRRRENGRTEKTRLYSISASPNVTSSNAEHRLLVRPSEVEQVAMVVARLVGVGVRGEASLSPERQRFAEGLAKDLLSARGKSVVVPGTWSSPLLQATAHAMNERLGNQGSTVFYFEPLRPGVGKSPEKEVESLKKLVQDMEAGHVECLVMLGGNPVYSAPADIPFATALAKVKTAVHASLYVDETSEKCKWRIPRTHSLEHWADGRGYDGTITLTQPLVSPLYQGKSDLEVLSLLIGDKKTGHEILKENWKSKGDKEWRKAIHDGFFAGTQSPAKRLSLKNEMWATMPIRNEAGALEVAFRPDPSVWDGRFSNNGWLQELPKPVTTLTWDNAVYVAPATAKKLKLESKHEYGKFMGDVVVLELDGRKIEAPVFVQPGHPEDTLTLPLGYGRTRAGRLGNGMGYNAGALRTATAFWSAPSVQLKKAGRKFGLASVQSNFDDVGRDPVRHTTLKKALENPHWAEHHEHGPKVMHEEFVGTAGGPLLPKAEADYQWGMAINLSTCTGCNACVVACQSENNIPIVGKAEVERGRHMHWLRIDHYYEGTPENPEIHHQPVNCMHCETAPCELVCPVNATTHDNEGLNNMVYNRCVGTKYCANNCPYKVRRFNFYEYALKDTPIIKMVHNPDVTVRSRGVMEKCSYCVQRISQNRITAKNEKRKIRDGEVKTACQTVCPSQAIVFGDISDPNSEVARLKKEGMNYGLLTELGTRPRTTYLGKVVNPNEALDGRNS